MFKNLFSKKKETNEKYILIAALLVHAAKIDKMYSDVEKKIIKKAIINLDQSNLKKIDAILEKAEKKEEESNQILEFTKEIKKYSPDFKFKIIEILWEIVYSDTTNDIYESNLIRRVCGLLYISDKDNGIIKLKVQKKLK